jgi:hypothetical protein
VRDAVRETVRATLENVGGIVHEAVATAVRDAAAKPFRDAVSAAVRNAVQRHKARRQ